MKIELTKTAIKQLAKLPKTEAKKVIKKIGTLESSPLIGKKLESKLSGKYSLKAWPYRIIYVFFPKQQLITVDTIEDRKSVYR